MLGKSNTIILTLSILFSMFLIVAFSAPLYNIFCRVTGYNGTTQYSPEKSNNILDRNITVRFNADINDSLNWEFKSADSIENFKIGENIKVDYMAKNLSSNAITGTATFNVIPAKVGPYFIKTECFCFQKQTLNPNEMVKMPVVFYVDPSIEDDPTMDDVETITLSYTFFKYIEEN